MPILDIFNSRNEAQGVKGRTLIELDPSVIRPNPNQPRVTFDDEAIDELAASIKQVGLIQPITVRKCDDGYELVAGERRLRAVKKLGLAAVTCIVQDAVGTESSAYMALIENLQREDLHYMEEAMCYKALIEEYSLTQEELALRLGKSQSAVANKLRLLRLPEPVIETARTSGLTERHARALLRLPTESAQMEAVKEMGEKGLSVKDSERLVEKTLNRMYDEKQSGARPRPAVMRMVKDYRLFMNTINAAVNQLRETGLVVEVDQLDREDGVDIKISVTRQ